MKWLNCYTAPSLQVWAGFDSARSVIAILVITQALVLMGCILALAYSYMYCIAGKFSKG